jgi:preprotein translocase subunit SecG
MDEQRAKQHEFVANMSKNNLARFVQLVVVVFLLLLLLLLA